MDRNLASLKQWPNNGVALRKESVDRNRVAVDRGRKDANVALRKESVDRNAKRVPVLEEQISRSPQGERG